jgi:hypothetical protein
MDIHARDPIASWVICTLDGKDVTRDCVFASEERGFAELIMYEKYRIMKVCNGEVLTKDVFGKVEFTLKEDAPEYARKLFQEARAGT